MISSEVQRTLVKSPPELWAELSDPALLARHLGELGEIRVTRVEPEQTVEWEAENATGKVQIKPSGWGTRVTLTATRKLDEAEPQAEPMCEIESDAAWPADGVPPFTPEPLHATDIEQGGVSEIQADGREAETEPLDGGAFQAHPYVWPIDDEPEPRSGFLARLFGRRRRPRPLEPECSKAIAAIDPESEPAGEIRPVVTEPPAPAASEGMEELEAQPADASLAPGSQPLATDASCEPALGAASLDGGPPAAEIAPLGQPQDAPPEPAQAPDVSTELKATEDAATAEVTAVLTSVLDRLGAAHHRPFSRS
jgi:hypothetical protein